MKQKASLSDLMIACCAGMLAPLIRLMPQMTTADAGRLGWLCALPAGLFVWATVRLMGESLSRLPDGAGLGGLLDAAFGRRWGRCLAALVGLLLLIQGMVNTRFFAERFQAGVYSDTDSLLFVAVLLGLVYVTGRMSLAALSRAGRVFFWVLAAVLVTVLLFGLENIRLYRLAPPERWEWQGVLRGSIVLLPGLNLCTSGLWLMKEVRTRPDWRRNLAWGMTALTVPAMVIGLVILGIFGRSLAAELQVPFFSLAREASLRGHPVRLEALCAAVWELSDLMLVSVQVRCAAAALEHGLGKRRLPWMRGCLPVILLAGQALLAPSMSQLERWYRTVWVPVSAVGFYLLPLTAATLFLWVKKGKTPIF